MSTLRLPPLLLASKKILSSTIIGRLYCKNKAPDKDKVTKLNQMKENTKLSKMLHIESNDDETLLMDDKKLISPTEREHDASVQGKISKECDVLTQKKIPLSSSSGLSLFLEINKEKIKHWDIDFDKTKEIKIPIKPPQKQPEIPKGDELIIEKTRLTRQEPGKVIWGFVPQEWVDFFIKKTGVTGFYTFLLTVGTCLISKEIYVLEHNFYGGLSVLILTWATVKYVGPHMAEYLDKEINTYEQQWQKTRVDVVNEINDAIDLEYYDQYQKEGEVLLISAKRENVHWQLEEEFRKRQMHVYKEVKKRLDYQLTLARIHRRYLQINLVDYVHREVSKSITPDMQDKLIYFSIDRFMHEIQRIGDTNQK